VLKDNITVNRQAVEITSRKYDASGGTEFFIAVEDADADALVGYVRLRIPSVKSTRKEVGGSAALVRELHVYGPEVPIGRHRRGAWQHTGFGRRLLAEAEQQAKRAGANKVLVLSALGTKEYYRRDGYSQLGPYMSKRVAS
jgi:elongator complex protein 3